MNTKRILVLILLAAVLLAACGTTPQETANTATSAIVKDTLRTQYVGHNLGAGIFAMIIVLAVTITVAYLLTMAEKIRRQTVIVLTVLTFLLCMVVAAFIGSYTTMNQTRVGVVLFQGKAVRAMQPGVNWFIPYLETGVTFPRGDWTYITSKDPTLGDEDYKDFAVDFVTADGVNSKATYTILGRIDPTMVMTFYERYGGLENAILQLVKEPARFEIRQLLQQNYAVDLITGLDKLDGSVVNIMRAKMADGGLILVDFGFRKPQLGLDINGNGVGDFEENLDAQRAAEEKAKAEQQMVAVSKAQADQAVAQAEGQKQVVIKQAEAQAQTTLLNQKALADAALYTAQQQAEQIKVTADATAYKTTKEAEAQAKANQLLAASINQSLIDYIKWSNWDGKLPIWVSGSDSSTFVTVPAPSEPISK